MSSTVTLVPSKTTIPRIGYGTGTEWFSGDNSKPINPSLVAAIREAFSLGYRHLDCAEMYGTDTSVGEAIRLEALPRDQLFITSKVFKTIHNIEKACDDVLSRLDIDYLDLWLIHSPFFDRQKISLEQAWKEMEKLVETGKVKAIGVSNFQVEHLQELLNSKLKIRPAVNQIELNPYLYKASRDLLDYCKTNEIAIESYAPLGSIVYKPGGPVDSVVENLANKYGRSPAQILLKWNLIKGDIAVTTSSKRDRLEDFLKVDDDKFELTNDDIQQIDEAGSKLHFRKYWQKEIDGLQQKQ